VAERLQRKEGEVSDAKRETARIREMEEPKRTKVMKTVFCFSTCDARKKYIYQPSREHVSSYNEHRARIQESRNRVAPPV